MYMYLYCERYEQGIVRDLLKETGLPNEGRVIKVFAADLDPRIIFANPNLYTIQSQSHFLNLEEVFVFGKRKWSGHEIENYLFEQSDDPAVRWVARALFRFSLLHGFTNAAMNITSLGKYRVEHPIDVIDGWTHRNPRLLHLDIFFPNSLKVMQRLIGNQDTVNRGQGIKWRSNLY